jgi:hypothetical protein
MDDILEIKELLTQFVEKTDILAKKVDKMVTLNTKIAKSLHLLPVTEREERELQLLQRKNLQLAAKVNDDLSAMQPPSETFAQLSIDSLDVQGIFSDVLGDEYLPNLKE